MGGGLGGGPFLLFIFFVSFFFLKGLKCEDEDEGGKGRRKGRGGNS